MELVGRCCMTCYDFFHWKLFAYVLIRLGELGAQIGSIYITSACHTQVDCVTLHLLTQSMHGPTLTCMS